jgi:hypothetical protein
VTAATTTTAAAATAIRGEIIIVERARLTAFTRECECREQAADFFAMAFCTHHVVGVLVSHQQFKL